MQELLPSTRISRNRLTLALVTVLIVVTAVGLSAGVALAHDAGPPNHMEHHCLAGEVCVFEAVNYDHGYRGWQGNVANYWLLNYSLTDDGHVHRVNDTASSIDNDGLQCGSRHFVDANHAGQNFWLPMGNAHANLGNIGFNNVLSSHRWCN